MTAVQCLILYWLIGILIMKATTPQNVIMEMEKHPIIAFFFILEMGLLVPILFLAGVVIVVCGAEIKWPDDDKEE